MTITPRASLSVRVRPAASSPTRVSRLSTPSVLIARTSRPRLSRWIGGGVPAGAAAGVEMDRGRGPGVGRGELIGPAVGDRGGGVLPLLVPAAVGDGVALVPDL